MSRSVGYYPRLGLAERRLELYNDMTDSARAIVDKLAARLVRNHRRIDKFGHVRHPLGANSAREIIIALAEGGIIEL
jgi:hypothetical protein